MSRHPGSGATYRISASNKPSRLRRQYAWRTARPPAEQCPLSTMWPDSSHSHGARSNADWTSCSTSSTVVRSVQLGDDFHQVLDQRAPARAITRRSSAGAGPHQAAQSRHCCSPPLRCPPAGASARKRGSSSMRSRSASTTRRSLRRNAPSQLIAPTWRRTVAALGRAQSQGRQSAASHATNLRPRIHRSRSGVSSPLIVDRACSCAPTPRPARDPPAHVGETSQSTCTSPYATLRSRTRSKAANAADTRAVRLSIPLAGAPRSPRVRRDINGRALGDLASIVSTSRKAHTPMMTFMTCSMINSVTPRPEIANPAP